MKRQMTMTQKIENFSNIKKIENIFHKFDSYSCPFCSSLPEILQYNEGNNTVKIKCKKHGENTLEINEYMEKMVKWENTSEIKFNNKCNIHNEQYSFYCQSCDENICKKCIKDSKKHENHIKYEINSLQPNNTEISLIKERINICLQKKEELKRKIKHLNDKINFFDTLIYTYEKNTPNYFLSINIKHLIHGEKLNFDTIKKTESINVLTRKEIFDDFIKTNFLNATEGLNQINLKNKNMGNELLEDLFRGIEDSTIFRILKFGGKIKESKEVILIKNIKILNLRGNNISSLKFLSGNSFPVLDILSLNDNKIESIDNLKNISFPLLTELYLSKNKITNIDVLSELNIKKLRVLWLSNNCITSIDILEKVKFPELVKLGLNKNKIKSLNVFENNKVKFPQLYELYLNDNEFNKNDFFKILKELYKKVQEFYY